jgi:PAS domain S-box-containing protein
MGNVPVTYEEWKYALPVMVLASLASILVGYGWFKRKSPLGVIYFFLMLTMASWMLLYSMILLFKTGFICYILALLEYYTIVALPLLWLLFALHFSEIKGWKSPGTLAPILLPAILLIVMATTNRAPNLLIDHHTFFGLERPVELVRMVDSGTNSPVWSFIHIGYSLLYFVIGTVLVIRTLNVSPKVDIRQSVLLSIGVIIPWLGNITFIFKISPIEKLDLGPVTMTLSGALLAWGLYYNKFINIVTTSRKLLVERMMDGLIILDKSNVILDINPAGQKIFKLTPQHVLGQPADIVFKPYFDIITNLRYTSRKHQEINIQIGNEIRYYDLDINPLYEKRGSLLGKMLILKDMTSLREAEKKLKEAKDRVQEADSLKNAFLANMSHEIRTPMNAIIGFSNLLNDETVTEEEKAEFIQHIKDSGNNLLQIIDDIIDISKLDSGQLGLNPQTFSVQRLLSELFSYFNSQMKELGKTHIKLLVKGIQSPQEWAVVGDVEKIRRVMRHMIHNGIKFTDKGFVEFGVEIEPSGNLMFYVQDTGIGIAREKQSLIFERFSSALAGTQNEYGGTGLGLAICKGLTNLMGGKIWVDSTLGSGSIFRFVVPVTKSDEYLPPLPKLEDFVPLSPPAFVTRSKPAASEPAEKMQPKAEEVLQEIAQPVGQPAMASVNLTSEVIRPPVQMDMTPPAPPFVPSPPPPIPPAFVEEKVAEIDPFDLMPKEAGLIFEPGDMPAGGLQFEDQWSSYVLLVIDPDEMSYLFLEMVLRKTKVNLVWVKHLREAMNFFEKSNRANGIILSSSLAETSVGDAINSLKKRAPSLPIIAITPFEGSQLNKQCLELGAVATVAKPVKPDKLIDALRPKLK